ncbi:MAG: FAD-binding dehydrogenase [Bacteroidetes bacterium 24-39-8]|nr:MAG: FAD-binding dehydrogenase [Bacteroidetes bacterium 24-39-8]
MIVSQGVNKRRLNAISINSDLVVVGGGISGVCAAISAARLGKQVTLVQDRPVLGGNSSSEVRLWILGATSHMGNNNRWSREGGVMDEILVENMHRNPEGNPVIFDTILLDKIIQEQKIRLLLNTAIYDLTKRDSDTIESLLGFCSQNQSEYLLNAPIYIDASGDGILGFLSGAAFRMGAESKEEFGELFAPTKAYGELLGHSMYFYSKDAGKPVKYIAPSYALSDITKIPRFKTFNSKDFGCKLWWIEYGGRLDTVHDTEQIKWELWKVVYGVWNYIKNSGEFPEAENLTLEWVGSIPGKRESRRFEGDYMLIQQDIVEQRTHDDAITYGGWSIDLHPADGVFSEKPGCNQWHSKGIYQIPYRCLYSKNIDNLFLAGRIISASHVAFASTRVMATSGAIGQAVGTAASICIDNQFNPRDLLNTGRIQELQQLLLKQGHYIPGIQRIDQLDLTKEAQLEVSSTLILSELSESGLVKSLESSVAQMIPLKSGKVPSFIVHATGEESTELGIELRLSSNALNYTPEIIIATKTISIQPGRNCISVDFNVTISKECYTYLVFLKNPKVGIHFSDQRITGILSLFNHVNPAVSNFGKQTPPSDIGVDSFEFWCPKRRPDGQNIAFKISDNINCFKVENLINGMERPTNQPNAWVSDYSDPTPTLSLKWDQPQKIKTIHLSFDTDFDHPMESVLMGHPERDMPFCVREFEIFDENGRLLHQENENYQTNKRIQFSTPITTNRLIIKLMHPSKAVPASLFGVRCYEN